MTNLLAGSFTFHQLVDSIQSIHEEFAGRASRAVNVSLTTRNWLIGCYIQEFEQDGQDRAEYGEKLLERLSDQLGQRGVTRTEARELRRYRQFYQSYPLIRDALPPEFASQLPRLAEAASLAIRESVTPVSSSDLITRLSFTHFVELLKCDSPEKRGFYESECIRGNWSVRELKRQINSLLYDRNVRTETDNPPVGILLRTEKDHSLVEYALAGMDNDLFVSRYQLELPTKETLRQQIEAERQRLEESR